MIKLLSVISLILGGLAAYFYRSSLRARKDALLGETKGEDRQLKRRQDEIRNQIDAVENRDDSQLTPEDRANRWNE